MLRGEEIIKSNVVHTPRPPLKRLGSSFASLTRSSSSMSQVLSRSASRVTALARGVSSGLLNQIVEKLGLLRIDRGASSEVPREHSPAPFVLTPRPRSLPAPFVLTPRPRGMPEEVHKLLLEVSAVLQSALHVVTAGDTLLVSAVAPEQRRAYVTVGWAGGFHFVSCAAKDAEQGGGRRTSVAHGPPGRVRQKAVRQVQLALPGAHGRTVARLPSHRTSHPRPDVDEPPHKRPAPALSAGKRPAVPRAPALSAGKRPAVPRVCLTAEQERDLSAGAWTSAAHGQLRRPPSPPPSLPSPPPSPPLPSSPSSSANAPLADVPLADAPTAAPVQSGAPAQRKRQRRPNFAPTPKVHGMLGTLAAEHAPLKVPPEKSSEVAATLGVPKDTIRRYLNKLWKLLPATPTPAAASASTAASASASAVTIAPSADDSVGATSGIAAIALGADGAPLENQPLQSAPAGSMPAPVPSGSRPESLPADARRAPGLHLPPGRYDVQGLQWLTQGNVALLHVFGCDPGVAEPISGVDVENITKRIRMTTAQRNRACYTRAYAQMMELEKPQQLRDCEEEMRQLTTRENSVLARRCYFDARFCCREHFSDFYCREQFRRRKFKAAIKKQVMQHVSRPFFSIRHCQFGPLVTRPFSVFDLSQSQAQAFTAGWIERCLTLSTPC